MVSPFIGQNIAEDQKKKEEKVFTAKQVGFSPKVCDDQKKKRKGLCLPISRFLVSKEKKTTNVVTPKW